MKKKPLIIIAGPTAVGKTSTSIELAKRINGEIISADSMQVYKQMDIGTAKIKKVEMDGVPHHLIDILEPEEEFNVAEFQRRARACYEEITARGKVPIFVGGTGFYLQAIIYDIDFEETNVDETYRKELNELAIKKGAEYVHEMLRKVDPKSAESIHFNNVKRMVRALEYYKQTGEPISTHNERERQKESPYDVAFFVLNMDRQKLYERVDMRVDIMLEEGLLDEVKGLLDRGCTWDMVSMRGLGYKEFEGYFNEDISLQEAIYILKRDTRHFAKRQLTWFRRENNVEWVDVLKYHLNADEIADYMVNYIKDNLHIL